MVKKKCKKNSSKLSVRLLMGVFFVKVLDVVSE